MTHAYGISGVKPFSNLTYLTTTTLTLDLITLEERCHK